MWFRVPLLRTENKCGDFFLFNSQLSSSSLASSKLKGLRNFALSHHCSKTSAIHHSHLAETSIALSQDATFCLARTPVEPRGQAGDQERRDSISHTCVPVLPSNLMEVSCSERIKPHSEIHLPGWIKFCPSPQEIWHFSVCHPLCLKTLNSSLLSKG